MSDVLDRQTRADDGAVVDRRDHYCVIGAGSSGLTGARHLTAQGIPVDVYEKAGDIGGNWNYGSPSSRVFHRTHLVSSKRLTQYPDFPMPADYPDFPSHWQAQQYLRAYARHFGIVERTRFQVSVEQVSREPDGAWLVRLHTGERYRYGGVVIANGHNWSSRRVSYPGEFSGTLIHSADRIYAMTEGHRAGVLAMVPEAEPKLSLLDPRGQEIVDPVGGGIDVYRRSSQEIEEAVRRRIDELFARTTR